jgi:hypothetical protein
MSISVTVVAILLPTRASAQGERGHHRPLCRHAGSRCGAGRGACCGRGDRCRHEADGQSLGGLPPADDNPRRRSVDRSRLHRGNRRSCALSAIPRPRGLSRLIAASLPVRRGRRQHLQVRGSTGANPVVRSANVMLTRYRGKLKLKDWAFAIAKRSTMREARIALARRLAIIIAPLDGGSEFREIGAPTRNIGVGQQ